MKLRLHYGIIAFLLLLSGQQAIGQFSAAYNFKFRTYTAKDGLVHNYTKKCLTDRKGFLWIITQHGLSRFDGLNFKNFERNIDEPGSLPDNDLQDIAIDRNNRIWLSYKRGICYYDRATSQFTEINFHGHSTPGSAIEYDSTRNCLWTSDYDNYYKIDCGSFNVTTYPYIKPLNTKFGVEQVYLDSKQRLWILFDRRGYFTVNLKTNTQYYYDQDIWPMHILEDEAHNIWMTIWSSGFRKVTVNNEKHQHTLYIDQYDPYGEIHYGITENEALTGKDILWITNSTQGLLFFDKKQGKFIREFRYDGNIKNGIASDFNNLCYTDPNGILWICTWHGLTKVNKREQQFTSRELPFLKTRNYNRLAGLQDDPYDNNILWLGVEGSGIMKFDKENSKPLERYFFNSGDSASIQEDINYDWRWIEMMITDSKKNIWASSYGGLIKISKGIVTTKPLKGDSGSIFPKTILEYPEGTLRIATGRGLYSFDIATEKYQRFQPDNRNNRFTDVIRENNGKLAIAGRSGAFEFDTGTHVFKKLNWSLKNIDSAGQQHCYCIKQLGNFMYIGTDAGLIVYDLKKGTAEVIGQKEGITKVYDQRLKTDAAGTLWIFTSNGLYNYDPNNKTFRKYTVGDGIYDFNEDKIGFFEYDHLFYIGYRMAMTGFDPLSVNVNRVRSTPLITGIWVNSEMLAVNIDSFSDHTLELPYKKNNISFEFTAADFTNSDKITFAYRLEGYDNDWIAGGTARKATYANLKGGTYTFHLKACNSSGLWNDREIIFRVKIATPFWQSAWFYGLVALLIFFIAYLLYRYRLSQLIELYKVRDAISKNLHDEIGATLSSIHIYSDVARKKQLDVNADKNEIPVLMDRIHKASGQVLESMNDIVWYVNPKNDTWDNILVRMREYAIPLLEAKNMAADFEIDDALLRQKLNMQQRQHIYFIFKEAVNNIVKYSGAQQVKVRLYKADKNLYLLIEDNGAGFNRDEVNSGNGLLNMQQRAIQMKGKLFIHAEKDKGTVVSLELPIT